jgi:DNA-directed RNA polymerase specialized sigma subunit
LEKLNQRIWGYKAFNLDKENISYIWEFQILSEKIKSLNERCQLIKGKYYIHLKNLKYIEGKWSEKNWQSLVHTTQLV